ncbi:MAG: transposase [Chitinophagaceae bacterium]|nr:transposase [Chitinophagaceae bacterium]
MPDYHIPLQPECIYHILSRANGNEKLFLNSNNYSFFLQRFEKHVSPVADTLCYCLLPNHFHFMVEIKSLPAIEAHFKEVKKDKSLDESVLSDFIMERFSNCLNSYTKSFNKMYNRKGSLFIDYMRRVKVETEEQFRQTVFYNHKNAVHHGLVKQINDWPWSSYHLFANKLPSWVQTEKVLGYFDTLEGFLHYHSQSVSLKIDPME